MARLALAALLLAGCVQAFDLDDPVVGDDMPPQDAGTGSGSGGQPPVPTICVGETVGGVCYERINEHLSWYAARDACSLRGGRLAKTESVEAFNAVARMLLTSESLHLGATDEGAPGLYRWLDGSYVLHPAWLPYQPDGADGAHCMVLLHVGAVGFNDSPCSLALPFVCERAKP